MDLSGAPPTFLFDSAGNSSVFFPYPDISSVAPLLTAVLALVSMLIASWFIMSWRSEKNVWIRLLGSLMVLCLALAANNWFVYFFAILVIATLITELDFLERVVAL